MTSNEANGSSKRVAVYGAGGHTGRFVVAELLRRGLDVVAVARDAAKLDPLLQSSDRVAVRAATVDDGGSLDRAFDGVTVVINCAGPFLDTAGPVASAALRVGAHYLDVTAEQPSARATIDTFGAIAGEAGLVVMPAMGFYGGLGDLLATAAMGDWDAADEIRIGIALDSWHPTAGTRITGERNQARRQVVSQGSLVPVTLPPREMDWEFPAPVLVRPVVEVPFSEIVTISSHLRAAELHNYLSRNALEDVRSDATPAPKPTDETGRSAQRFLVEAVASKGGIVRRVAVRGRDIYAFSAPLVCEAAARLLDHRAETGGAMAPGAMFEPIEFLAALESADSDFRIIQR
ncbi:saccharopine dehydrogenase family protein [Sphingopyxis indica]|uniref:Saccharopine dehydrogenase NADP binding domain-containing protein n=1 Tax=Sphingopyxis indica TaxID=436663 RepID=A0A239HC16_9SPHN|nr:saccharopine dehydrogenase NADP-binding domain-containing protein [Sphingopyxis indica]SNS78568.1 Saccharopine dehydrogenase NADP binding domain-containing protein [Sphingopyxis indica]